MMLKRILVMAAASAALVAVAATQNAIDLKLKVKEGQVFNSKVTAQVDYQGTPIDVTATNVATIKSVKDGTIVMLNETKDLTIDLGGSKMEQPDSSVTLTQNERGRILKIESDMAGEEANRLQNAFNFFYPEKPVKVGDKWDTTVEADAAKGTPEIKAHYEAVETKKWKNKDVLVLKVSQSESGNSPISLDGTFTIDIATGIPVGMEFTFKNMPQGGMLFDGTWKAESTD